YTLVQRDACYSERSTPTQIIASNEVSPEAEDFDPEVAVLAGEGLKHGRLWFGDGCVNPAKEEMAAKEQAAQEQRAHMEQQIHDDGADATAKEMMQQQAQMSWLMSQMVLSTPPGSIAAPPPYSMPWMPPPPTQTPGTPVTVNNMNIIRRMNRDPYVRRHSSKPPSDTSSDDELHLPLRSDTSSGKAAAGAIGGTELDAAAATIPRRRLTREEEWLGWEEDAEEEESEDAAAAVARAKAKAAKAKVAKARAAKAKAKAKARRGREHRRRGRTPTRRAHRLFGRGDEQEAPPR
ncbi:hypothetical protein QYE76_007981, partial [Lolium multiflorum]